MYVAAVLVPEPVVRLRGAPQDGGMGTVDDYLARRDEPRRAQLERLYAIAEEVVAQHGGTVEQGESYGMAALLYRGKGLFSAQDTAKHIGVYPFSATAVEHIIEEFGPGHHAKGALRYPFESSAAEPQIRSVVAYRLGEIDARLDKQ